MKKDIQVLSPVGSYETLQAAIQAGADAVYFGVGNLNMRSRSTANFTIKDLAEIVKICKKNNVNSYLAVNTVIYDHEMDTMKKLVDAAKKNKVTAIIASDQSVMNYAHSIGVQVNASTQLNISNIEAVKFYAQFVDVIVLARELNLKQVKEIVDEIKRQKITGPMGKLIKIEIFVHGALCMAISGKCYMSLHTYNHSANRGACLQVCRRAYELKDKETGDKLEVDNEYIMSPQDLCTIEFIDKIIDAGVSILKIEGRARPPEYVKTVTSCYKEAVEAHLNNSFNNKKAKAWKKKLSTVFNRGFWDGYYLGTKLGKWSDAYGSKATHKKIYVAKGQKYYDKLKIGEFKVEADTLKVKDKVYIMGPTTGVIETEVKEIRLDDKSIKKAKPGDIVSIPIPDRIRKSDKLYKLIENK
ncbi:U32 family peptidase [Patescibacteria group bacterium]|nr:U32 family peptidase [Patescibacteria group bacterium]